MSDYTVVISELIKLFTAFISSALSERGRAQLN